MTSNVALGGPPGALVGRACQAARRLARTYVLLRHRAAVPLRARCSSGARHQSALLSGETTQQLALLGRQCWCTAVPGGAAASSPARPPDGRLHTTLCAELHARAYRSLSRHLILTVCTAAHRPGAVYGPRTAPVGYNPTLLHRLPPHPCNQALEVSCADPAPSLGAGPLRQRRGEIEHRERCTTKP